MHFNMNALKLSVISITVGPMTNSERRLIPGYLSCCRFIDDNQIITSSGDTTW